MSRNVFPPSGEYHVAPDNTSHNVTNMEKKYIFRSCHNYLLYLYFLEAHFSCKRNCDHPGQKKKKRKRNLCSIAGSERLNFLFIPIHLLKEFSSLKLCDSLTLYTITSVSIFSILFSIRCY